MVVTNYEFPVSILQVLLLSEAFKLVQFMVLLRNHCPYYLGRVPEESYPPVRAVPVRPQQRGVAVEGHAWPPRGLEVGQGAHDARHAHPEQVCVVRVREVLLDQGDGVERPRVVVERPVVPDVGLPLIPDKGGDGERGGKRC